MNTTQTKVLEQWQKELPEPLASCLSTNQSMAPLTTLRVGGPAQLFARVDSRSHLAELVLRAQADSIHYTLIGGGSNVCIADNGIKGLVIYNRTQAARFDPTIDIDTGSEIMAIFRQFALRGLSGLEFAVGIPGTIGGALASNAGAYRQNICDIVESVDVVADGRRRIEPPDWMEFQYRDSRLRQPLQVQPVVLGVTLKRQVADRKTILDRARENQRQRIFKQPWLPSAGSFFKNVGDRDLAEAVVGLPGPLKRSGVVPAGYLSAACGCKGLRLGGAMISRRHGNFVINIGNATAAQIRQLTQEVKSRVFDKFGVHLKEEVQFVGDWEEGDWRRDSTGA